MHIIFVEKSPYHDSWWVEVREYRDGGLRLINRTSSQQWLGPENAQQHVNCMLRKFPDAHIVNQLLPWARVDSITVKELNRLLFPDMIDDSKP